jgi:hypothetical protein
MEVKPPDNNKAREVGRVSDNSRQEEMTPTKQFEAKTRTEEEDLYGMALLTDGDRMGEMIPSMFAWMPMEAMRERVKYMEEVTRALNQKETEARKAAARKEKSTVLDVPPWPTAQSDQLLHSDQAARARIGNNELSNELEPNQARKAQGKLNKTSKVKS